MDRYSSNLIGLIITRFRSHVHINKCAFTFIRACIHAYIHTYIHTTYIHI